MNEAPNHALQRTAPRVTVAAISGLGVFPPSHLCPTSVASFCAPPSQLPRHAPPSLSLGSLAVAHAFSQTDGFKKHMKPKIITALSLLVLATHALAQVTPKTEPPELIARRAEHLRAISRAQIPPLTAYLRTLEPLKQQLARDGKSDAALAVDAEIQSIRQQLQAAQSATDITTAAPVQFQLDSAVFGDPATKRVRDVTAAIRAAMDSGQPTMFLDNGQLGGDPAPGTKKVVVITYTINGKKKDKTFKADTALDFKKDLR